MHELIQQGFCVHVNFRYMLVWSLCCIPIRKCFDNENIVGIISEYFWYFIFLFLVFISEISSALCTNVFCILTCTGPLGRSHESDRFPPMRGRGFDMARSQEHDVGFGLPVRETEDFRNR